MMTWWRSGPSLNVSKPLGHGTSDSTLRYYAHWIPDAGTHVFNQLDLGTTLLPSATNAAPPEETTRAEAPQIISKQ
jgi:hypothetical protein